MLIAQGGSTAEDASTDAARSFLIVGSIILVVAALGMTCGLCLARQVMRPLGRTGEIAERIVRSDLSHTIDISCGNDEIDPLLTRSASTQSNLGGMVAGIRQGSQSVVIASAEIAQGEQRISQIAPPAMPTPVRPVKCLPGCACQDQCSTSIGSPQRRRLGVL